MEFSQNGSLSADSDENLSKLRLLENAGFISILEDAIDQVIILGSSDIFADVKHADMEIESLKNRAAKYSKNDPIYNCLNGEIFTMTLNKMKFLKLHMDRAYLEEILTQIRDELCEKNSFETLQNFLANFRDIENEEQTLISDQSYNKSFAVALKSIVKNKAEDSRKELIRVNEIIAKCKDDMESFLFDNALKIRYLENWENARIEQGYMMCDQNEQELTDSINKYKNEIEKEIRINAEIQTYIAENQKDMEESIENWVNRYETELEEKQVQTQMYKDKREEQKKRYETMLVTYEMHAKQIQDWLEYKEKKRIQDEIDKQRNDAATKLQSWWRGMMFRLGLGCWNPDQSKKKKEKKKKEKKGKKGKKKK